MSYYGSATNGSRYIGLYNIQLCFGQYRAWNDIYRE